MCEHVALHECLHESAPAPLRVATQADLLALRTFDDRLARRMLWFGALGAAALAAGLLWRRRRRRRHTERYDAVRAS